MTSGATDEITPRVLRTPRAAGLAGIVFAVLFGLIVVLLRKVVPPDPHAAGAWLTKAGSRREIQFALGLVPFCGIFFLWFMGAVRSRIGENEDKFLATVFLGSGLLFIAMLFVFSALFGALIGVAGLHHGNPPLDIWQLIRTGNDIQSRRYLRRADGGRVHDRGVDNCLPAAGPQPGGGRIWLRRRGAAALRELVDPLADAGLPGLGPAREHQHRRLVIPRPRSGSRERCRSRLSPSSKTAGDYLRMFTARATTRIPTTTEIASSAIIMSFAHGLIAETSVGLNAIAALKERCR